MPVAPSPCDPDTLLAAAKCFECIPPGAQAQVQTYLLAVLAGASLDPNVLLEQAKCFRCLDGWHAQVQTYLLCQIAAAV